MRDEKIVREEICEIGRRMYGRRMVAANDGNISVRLSENEIICTPTGVSKGFMKPEQLCKMDVSGNVLEGRRVWPVLRGQDASARLSEMPGYFGCGTCPSHFCHQLCGDGQGA